MKASQTNQTRDRIASAYRREIKKQLQPFQAMSPHIASRDLDLFPQGHEGPTGYDKEKIYVRVGDNPALIRKAIELREAGATHVMIHRRSVSGRYSIPPTSSTNSQFRTRRMEMRLNYELKA